MYHSKVGSSIWLKKKFKTKEVFSICSQTAFFWLCLSQLPIVDESECQRNMEENGLNFTKGVICTETSGKGTCHVSKLFLCVVHIKDVDDRQILEKSEVLWRNLLPNDPWKSFDFPMNINTPEVGILLHLPHILCVLGHFYSLFSFFFCNFRVSNRFDCYSWSVWVFVK